MKRLTFLKISGVLLLVLPLLGYAQEAVDVSDEIMAVNKIFMEAIKSKDVETLVNQYTEECRVMPSNMPLIEGRENIRAMWTGTFESGSMNLQLKTVSAEAFGTTAIEEGKYEVVSPDGQVVDNGKYIVIWKKVNGKWLLHQDIFNSSVPAPGM